MKTVIITLLIAFGVSFSSDSVTNDHLEFLNYGNFKLKVTDTKIVDEVDTKDGEISADNSSNNLIEVKIEGVSTKKGIMIYNTSIFSAVFKHRGFYRVVPSKACGFKPEIAPGEIVEVLISSDDASMNNVMGSESNEEFFLYFEIPKEVKDFQIQIPQLLTSTANLK